MDKSPRPRMTIRLPADLQAALQHDADEAGHSVNAEIVRRLDLSYRIEETQRLEKKVDAILAALRQTMPPKAP